MVFVVISIRFWNRESIFAWMVGFWIINVDLAIYQPYLDFEAGDNLWKFKWRGWESNPGPLASRAKSLTTRPPLLPGSMFAELSLLSNLSWFSAFVTSEIPPQLFQSTCADLMRTENWITVAFAWKKSNIIDTALKGQCCSIAADIFLTLDLYIVWNTNVRGAFGK